MQRTPVNPWDWSLNLSYNQGEIIDGPLRQLICAGQTAVDGEGNPQHPNDMRRQIGLTLGSGPINFVEAFKPVWFNPGNCRRFYEQSLLAERRSNEAASAIFPNEPR